VQRRDEHRWLPRSESVAIVAVAASAVLVRLPGTWSQSFWEDEVASARVIHTPTLAAALSQIVKTESTPPLWYLLVWSLHRLGLPIVDARLLSVAAGAALTVLVVLLGRRFLPFRFALATGALVAVGSEFVDHGHELRAYELLAALTALFALLLLDFVAKPTRRRALQLAVVVAAGGLTHFFFAFSIAAAAAWAAFDPSARPLRRRILLTLGAGSLLPLAWLPLMLAQYHAGRFWWIGAFRVRHVLAIPLRLFTYAYSRPPVGPTLSAAMFLLVLAGALRLGRHSSNGRLIACLALAPLAAAAALWAAGLPIFDLRNLIGSGPFIAISAIAALEAAPRQLAAAGTYALTAAIAASLALSPPAPTPPFAQISHTLLHDGWNGTQAIAVVGDPARYLLPLEWYLPGQPKLRIATPSRLQCAETFVLSPGSARVNDPRNQTTIPHGESLLVEPSSHRCNHLRPRRINARS